MYRLRQVPIQISPKPLTGPWEAGFALDLHTTSSVFIGYNSYGHPEFDTRRPPVAKLLYALKNRGDQRCVEPLAEAAVGFLRDWKPRVDLMVAVPPSNAARKRQPVIEVARAISRKTGLRIYEAGVVKVKSTPQLKDVFAKAERDRILRDAFDVDPSGTEGKRVLLFDDLYRSGATAGAITKVLLGKGAAARVCLLTSTRTRRNL